MGVIDMIWYDMLSISPINRGIGPDNICHRCYNIL